MVRNIHLLFSFAALALVAGCNNAGSGGVDESGAAIGALDLGPTVVVSRDVWEPAPAGCDGRLPLAGVSITGAAGAPGLRVAMDGDTAVCADSADGMLDALHLADLVPVRVGLTSPIQALPSWLFSRRDSASGDPSPQPSAPVSLRWVPIDQGNQDDSPTDGDPSPQPSQPQNTNTTNTSTQNTNNMMDGKTDGDPSPQPSQPRAGITHVMF